jgi:hypothetical protein
LYPEVLEVCDTCRPAIILDQNIVSQPIPNNQEKFREEGTKNKIKTIKILKLKIF